MVELYYKWIAPTGESNIGRGRFLSYKHAYNCIAMFNMGGWIYIPVWDNSCQLEINVDYPCIDHTKSYPHLA